jgi:methyl-accepting chemotaxis protein
MTPLLCNPNRFMASSQSNQTQPANFLSQVLRSPAKLRSRWNNLKFINKLTILLLGSVAIPAIAITQSIVIVSQAESIASLQKVLQSELALLSGQLNAQKSELVTDSQNLATALELSQINVNKPLTSIEANQLTQFIDRIRQQSPDRSFYLITDAKGNTVAQHIQKIDGDLQQYPKLPLTAPVSIYQPVTLPTGISLNDMPIVTDSRQTRHALAGFELLPHQVWQRLGLAEQAQIGMREQKTAGLPAAKQPYPAGTYDLDRGTAGLGIVAAQPITVRGQVVGMTIVGTLLNRNFDLIDRFTQATGATTATIFAQDWQVSSNVPYTDGNTRAIGTRVSREVADRVLNQGNIFSGKTNIIGTDYYTSYSPLFDRRQSLNPQVKPIGMVYVGKPVQSAGNIALLGYGIGGLISLLAAIAIFPISRSFSQPLKRLAIFVEEVGEGGTALIMGRRLDEGRQDEIGILSTEINQMLARLEAHKTEEIDTAYRQTDIARQMAQAAETARQLTVDQVDRLTNDSVRQSKQIGQTLTSVDAMIRSIQQVADNARLVVNMAQTSTKNAKQGETTIAMTSGDLSQLQRSNSSSTSAIQELQDYAQQISQSILDIDQITAKTRNIALFLETETLGRGIGNRELAHTIEEISSLTGRSATVTRSMKTLVEQIQSRTDTAVRAVESEDRQVGRIAAPIDRTKQNLASIVQVSEQIDILVQSIATATVSHSQTAKNVKTLMRNISNQTARAIDHKILPN